MVSFLRYTAPQRIIALVLLPFVLVYIHGASVAWLIYEWEWEDILTHHFQTLNPYDASNKARGAAYIHQALEKHDAPVPDAPQPPLEIQELRAVLHELSAHLPEINFFQSRIIPRATGLPTRGFFAEVFRPPCDLCSLSVQ